MLGVARCLAEMGKKASEPRVGRRNQIHDPFGHLLLVLLQRFQAAPPHLQAMAPRLACFPALFLRRLWIAQSKLVGETNRWIHSHANLLAGFRRYFVEKQLALEEPKKHEIPDTDIQRCRRFQRIEPYDRPYPSVVEDGKPELVAITPITWESHRQSAGRQVILRCVELPGASPPHSIRF